MTAGTAPPRSPGQLLRAAHAAARPLVSPLAHDALSARLIERAGFPALNIGGSALLAARHALPDLGLAGLGEMEAGIRDIAQAVSIPCLVDADDGYGDVKSVARTVIQLERAGVGGLLLEDQMREGKQPGATAARGVVPLPAMEQKLLTALDARASPDLVIIGRTDALGRVGMDEALRRAERFLRLGADGVFVAGLRTREQFEQVGRCFRGSWNAAAVFAGGSTPWITPADLHAMGFSQVAYPNYLILRVTHAIESALGELRDLAGDGTGDPGAQASGRGAAALAEAIGLATWEARERRFAPEAEEAGRTG